MLKKRPHPMNKKSSDKVSLRSKNDLPNNMRELKQLFPFVKQVWLQGIIILKSIPVCNTDSTSFITNCIILSLSYSKDWQAKMATTALKLLLLLHVTTAIGISTEHQVGEGQLIAECNFDSPDEWCGYKQTQTVGDLVWSMKTENENGYVHLLRQVRI